MIVLDEPYASKTLLKWVESSQHPVLDTTFVKHCAADYSLHVISAEETLHRIGAGERVYTNSENALEWIVAHALNEGLVRAVRIFKDKAYMREVLASADPQLFFKTCSVDELFKLDFSSLVTPFVLKPQVGFCSIGVFAIQCREDWERALADISANASTWHARYPDSVVGSGSFILEGYIEGTEYAVDAYFDQTGASHVLNVLRHDFISPEDTSDRLYLTSPSIVLQMAPALQGWLNRVNALVGARNFPVHVEVRVKEGHITPIEFNPLRFAGLGGTDISWFGYGYRTYEAFLEDTEPDFEKLFRGKEDKVYSMSLLTPSEKVRESARFDYGALRKRFSHVLDLQAFDVDALGAYGFLFLETDADCASERDFIMHTDLSEFLRFAGEC